MPERLEDRLKRCNNLGGSVELLNRLGAYCNHQAELLRAFEKNEKKHEDGLGAIQTWADEIQNQITALK